MDLDLNPLKVSHFNSGQIRQDNQNGQISQDGQTRSGEQTSQGGQTCQGGQTRQAGQTSQDGQSGQASSDLKPNISHVDQMFLDPQPGTSKKHKCYFFTHNVRYLSTR